MIIVKNLTKNYGNNRGIFNLSFQIKEGSCVGFLGPNGAGKTTTIRHLLGLIQNYTGSASIKNLNCKTDSVEIQKYIGYLPGEINFIDDIKGNELIDLISAMKEMSNLDYAYELLQLFELKPNMKIHKMSKGMKQKLAIVIAFMNDPEILILDEPSSGLDPLMQQRLIELILDHKKRGKTIFLSSHSFEEVEKTCDRIIMIKDGHIVNDSHIEQLIKEQIRKYEVKFSKESDVHDFLKKHHGTQVDNLTVLIELEQPFNELINTLSSYNIQDITKNTLKLEEIFMNYYGESYDKYRTL